METVKAGKIKSAIKRFFTYNPSGNPRVWELDLLRGILIIVVTIDHVLLFGYYWNLLHFYGPVGEFFRDEVFLAYLTGNFRSAVEPFGLWMFALLSGISSALTKNPKKRTFKTCAVTAVFMGVNALLHLIIPNLVKSYLIFNILAIISIGTIVEWIMVKLKTPNSVRFVLSTVSILVGITYYYVYFIGSGISVGNDFLAMMIYNSNGYVVSANNFEPLFPHLGFFMLGALVGRLVYKDKKSVTSMPLPPKYIEPIALTGKLSLVIYLFGATAMLIPLILIDVIVGLFC